jgi:thioredoxin-related protein
MPSNLQPIEKITVWIKNIANKKFSNPDPYLSYFSFKHHSHMKQIIVLTFCFLSILKSTAQGTISCDSLIKKQYKISEVKNNQHFLEEVRAAILCKYDSLDMYIFMGPNGNGPLTMIAPLAVKRIGTSHENKISMSELMQTFSSIRDMPGYGELRNKITLIMQQVKLGISDQLYKDRPVTENKDDIVATKINKQQIVAGVYAFTNYKEGLSKAMESGKPLLIYFTGYACIPARKFEDQVLRDPHIQEIIKKHFEVVCLYVDDRTPLTQEKIYHAKSLKRDIKYLGDIHQELQIDKFQSNRQPMFFILDKAGKRIATSGMTGVKEFSKFLSMRNQ